jgi:hypothetical protein
VLHQALTSECCCPTAPSNSKQSGWTRPLSHPPVVRCKHGLFLGGVADSCSDNVCWSHLLAPARSSASRHSLTHIAMRLITPSPAASITALSLLPQRLLHSKHFTPTLYSKRVTACPYCSSMFLHQLHECQSASPLYKCFPAVPSDSCAAPTCLPAAACQLLWFAMFSVRAAAAAGAGSQHNTKPVSPTACSTTIRHQLYTPAPLLPTVGLTPLALCFFSQPAAYSCRL